MKRKYKRHIPKGHCIRIFLWRNTNPAFNVSSWEGYKRGDSTFQTGAGSLNAAMKIVKDGLDDGYTHFRLSYPIAMNGMTANEPTD